MESTLVSEADSARIAAEEALHSQWQRRAARVVAAAAADVADCRLLLDVLGLDAGIARAARAERPASAPHSAGAEHSTSVPHSAGAEHSTSAPHPTPVEAPVAAAKPTRKKRAA